MYISTRKYLKDIRKAEKRGYLRGRHEAYEEIDRNRAEARNCEKLERLERYVGEMKLRLEEDRWKKDLKETGVSCVTCNTEEPKTADV